MCQAMPEFLLIVLIEASMCNQSFYFIQLKLLSKLIRLLRITLELLYTTVWHGWQKTVTFQMDGSGSGTVPVPVSQNGHRPLSFNLFFISTSGARSTK